MRRHGRPHVLLIALLVLLVALAGCNGPGGASTDTATEADAVGDDDESNADGNTDGSNADDDDESNADDDDGSNAGDGGDGEAETTAQPRQQVTNRLQVFAATGSNIENGTVGSVNLTVGTAPGADDVDLRSVTVQWVDDSGTYDVVARTAEVDAADGHFGVSAVEDSDGSAPLVNDPEDRLVLTMELGGGDLATDGSGRGAFAERLDAGETATLRLTTETGATTTVRLVVPESLDGREAVRL